MWDGVGVVFSAASDDQERRVLPALPRLSDTIFIDPRLHLALSLLAAAGAAGGEALAGGFMIAAAALVLSMVTRPELNGRAAGTGPFSAVELGLLLWKSNACFGRMRHRLTLLAESALAASMVCLVIGAIVLPVGAIAVAAAINLIALVALRLSLAGIVRADLAAA